MREALALDWDDPAVAVATVVSVAGSAPRPVGSHFFVGSTGSLAGSVSGGCVENDVAVRAERVLETGCTELVEYGIADDEAFDVGLTCGGTIGVFIQPMPTGVLDAVGQLVVDERLGAIVTVLTGDRAGAVTVLDEHGDRLAGPPVGAIAGDARTLMAVEGNGIVESDGLSVFVETIAPPPTMLVFGAGHVAQPLSIFARRLGFRVVVGDARAAWATPERFPEVDDLVVDWPAAVLARHPLDRRTSVVLLSHDARFEAPVLDAVRTADVGYIGVMGSRRTHRARIERLREEGWTDDQIGRIHGPIGLDIGARTPEETAVSIMGEVVAARYGHDPGISLADGTGPIHR